MDIKQNPASAPSGPGPSSPKADEQKGMQSNVPSLLVRTMKQDLASQGQNASEKDLSIKQAPAPVFSMKPASAGASAPPNLPIQQKSKPSLDIPQAKPLIPEIPKIAADPIAKPVFTQPKEQIQPAPAPISAPIPPKPAPTPQPIAPKPIIPPTISQNRPSIPPKPEIKTETGKKPSIPPVKPLVPPGEEIKKIAAKSSSGFKFALAIGLVLIALTLLAGGWYWWQKNQNSPVAENTPTPTPVLTPTQTPVPQPNPLFLMDGTEISILDYPATDASREQAINILANTSRNQGFSHVIFKNNENSFLTLKEITDYFNITFFNAIGTSTDIDFINPEQFSFFVYSQQSSSSTPFAPHNRAGAAIAVKYPFQDGSQLMQAIKIKENSILQELDSLFLNNQIDIALNKEFQDNTYQGIPIRYINLPTSDISLDYAVANNLLIIATSKQSMYAAIDRILGSSGK